MEIGGRQFSCATVTHHLSLASYGVNRLLSWTGRHIVQCLPFAFVKCQRYETGMVVVLGGVSDGSLATRLRQAAQSPGFDRGSSPSGSRARCGWGLADGYLSTH